MINRLLKLIVNPFVLLYDIALNEKGIEFLLFRYIVIAIIRYENIDFVKRQNNLVSPVTAYRFVNRFSNRYVIYKKKAWFSKYVVVSPEDGNFFESKLLEVGVIVK